MSGLGLRTTGRASKPLTIEIEKELGDLDLAQLTEERGVSAPQLITLRERHHALARLLAEGKTVPEASALTRYSISRISILKSDPAFQELVEHYRAQVNHAFVDFQEKLKDLAIDAANILHERLEDSPQDISETMLLRIVEVGADRTGHGPSSKQEINVKVGIAERMQEARARIAARTSQPSMKDITPED